MNDHMCMQIFIRKAYYLFQDLTINRLYRLMPGTNFTNIHPVGVALYYGDRQDQANIRIFADAVQTRLNTYSQKQCTEGVNWIHLALGWFEWRVLLKRVIHLRCSKKFEIYWQPSNFQKRLYYMMVISSDFMRSTSRSVVGTKRGSRKLRANTQAVARSPMTCRQWDLRVKELLYCL